MFKYDKIDSCEEFMYYGVPFKNRRSNNNTYLNAVMQLILNLDKNFTKNLGEQLNIVVGK
jgi:hypothetical protein